MDGLPVSLPTYPVTCGDSAVLMAHDRRLPQGIVMCFWRVALEGGLRGGVGICWLETFKIKVILAGFSKLSI